MERPLGRKRPVATVGALIEDDSGRFLMVRTHKWGHRWGIPGGKIERGEEAEAALRREIRTAREKSDGILGVNIMVAVNDFHELLEVAIEEKVDLVFMGAGLPIKNIPVYKMRAAGVKAVPIISSARAAEMIFKMWKKIYNDEK